MRSVSNKYLDKNSGKWLLKMWFTRSKKCKTKLVQSRNFESEKEASETASSWRLSWERGSHGDKIDPMSQNTEHLCSTCGGNGGSVALKLPRGRSFVDLSKCST